MLTLYKIPSQEHCEKFKIKSNELLKYANLNLCSGLLERGGGVKKIELSIINEEACVMIYIDVIDVMGAGVAVKVAEGIKIEVERILNINVLMCTPSNLTPERVTFSMFTLDIGFDNISLNDAKNIVQAYHISKSNIFRAITHNKGIMNGVSAIALATGQDSRALEASCHSWSQWKNKSYLPLSGYKIIEKTNQLQGWIELPLSVGIAGGSIKKSKFYTSNLEFMKAETSKDLAQIMASIGLAQNFAALLALVTNGVSYGHEKLKVRT